MKYSERNEKIKNISKEVVKEIKGKNIDVDKNKDKIFSLINARLAIYENEENTNAESVENDNFIEEIKYSEENKNLSDTDEKLENDNSLEPKGFKKIIKDEISIIKECFQNTFLTLTFMKGASFLEKFLMLFILIIPAFFGAMLGLPFLLLLFVLYLISLFFNQIEKGLTKLENRAKNNFLRKKSESDDNKNHISFLNRIFLFGKGFVVKLINGSLFLVIRGVKIPIKTINDINKAISFILQKFNMLASAILRAPSELLLRDARIPSLVKSKEVSQGRKRSQGGKIDLDRSRSVSRSRGVKIARERDSENVKSFQIRPRTFIEDVVASKAMEVFSSMQGNFVHDEQERNDLMQYIYNEVLRENDEQKIRDMDRDLRRDLYRDEERRPDIIEREESKAIEGANFVSKRDGGKELLEERIEQSLQDYEREKRDLADLDTRSMMEYYNSVKDNPKAVEMAFEKFDANWENLSINEKLNRAIDFAEFKSEINGLKNYYEADPSEFRTVEGAKNEINEIESRDVERVRNDFTKSYGFDPEQLIKEKTNGENRDLSNRELKEIVRDKLVDGSLDQRHMIDFISDLREYTAERGERKEVQKDLENTQIKQESFLERYEDDKERTRGEVNELSMEKK